MSVVVLGMEMPTACVDCELYHNGGEYGDGAEQTCRTCRWHGQTSHSCYQPGSPHATEQTADETSCDYWEGLTHRENLRKEVENQLG